MQILLAPQAMKGSLTAIEVCHAIEEGVKMVFPDAHTISLPIADGGEGTVQALIDASNGSVVPCTATGPLGEPVDAFYGIMGSRTEADSAKRQATAVIEMSACAGLPLVSPEQRNPAIATTRGVGELILAALDNGCRDFILGLGGSATNDGGAGMAQALGAKLLDARGKEIAPGGAALQHLSHIDVTELDPRLRESNFIIASDVTNPLCGPEGASAIYGPQKGATPTMVAELDSALEHYARIIKQDLARDVATEPGAGAAGGLGAGMLAFLQAKIEPGADVILNALQFHSHLQNADLVITAEGQLDRQTAYGKSVGTVARAAQQTKVPVLALAGGLGGGYRALYDAGIAAISVLPSRPMPLAYAMEHAATLTTESIERALRCVQLGLTLRQKGGQ